MAAQPLYFHRLRDPSVSLLPSFVGLQIVQLFESTINSSEECEIQQKTVSMYTQLSVIIPPDTPPEHRAVIILDISRALVRISSCIPLDHYAQTILERVVNRLPDCQTGGEILAQYLVRMSEEWHYSTPPDMEVPAETYETDADFLSDPTSDYNEDTGGRQFTTDEWLNINSFAAKLYATTMPNFGCFALWEIRTALEDDDNIENHIFDGRVRIACEWFIRSSDKLLCDALQGAYADTAGLPQGDSYCAGPLFPGPRGSNLERWGWWKRALVIVGDDVDVMLLPIIGQAIVAMTAAEGRAAVRASPAIVKVLKAAEAPGEGKWIAWRPGDDG